MNNILDLMTKLIPDEETAHRVLMIFLAVSAVMSAVTFAVYGVDKGIAKANGKAKIVRVRRVPEKTLLWLSFLFGSPGAMLGMIVFHHKTRKTRFAAGVPLMLTGWLAVGILLYLTEKYLTLYH